MDIPVPMEVDEEASQPIIAFHDLFGFYGCFSQFYKCSAPILIYGKMFQYSESAITYAKASLFPGNDDIKQKILRAEYPYEIIGLGHTIRNFNKEIWSMHEYKIIVECNRAKFKHNLKLLLRLSQTKNAILVNASPYDKILGAGIDERHPDINHPTRWSGQNLLGRALMEIRDNF